MPSNLDRYKEDLNKLISTGQTLEWAMQYECMPADFTKRLQKQTGEKKAKEFVKALPRFAKLYQAWYSEAKTVIRQLLPDRLEDFVRHYEKPKPRKDITYENYRIDDYLQGLSVTRGYEKTKVVGQDAAIPQFQQQLAILEAVKNRFESSLFDIKQLVQADLFDSELDAASALLKAKHFRAAGALAGVVLESHLGQVCENHKIAIRKKNPTIADFNDAMKQADVVEVAQWRFIQHLADIRNLCSHKKERDPNVEEVGELIAGVGKITKTLY